jgi:hypothetical protein
VCQHQAEDSSVDFYALDGTEELKEKLQGPRNNAIKRMAKTVKKYYDLGRMSEPAVEAEGILQTARSKALRQRNGLRKTRISSF